MNLQIQTGDAVSVLKQHGSESVNCCVTSPPYWGLRDYGVAGQLGLEKTPEIYVEKMVEVFGHVRRVLRSDGTLWLNLGDSYSGGGRGGNPGRSKFQKQRTNEGSLSVRGVQRSPLKDKDLIGIPWMVAFALRSAGWWLRSAIIWAKPNGMPGSQEDRPTSSYEYVFFCTKAARYWSDFDAIKTPPRESSMVRLAQDIQAQAGSHRANGGAKTNGTMKALSGGQPNIRKARDKQRGHSRRHAGFNDRWDQMTRAEQQSMPVMMRDVWFIPPAQFRDAHFAVMPEEVARRCILAGCPPGGTVLDPFAGSGTVGKVALEYGRGALLVELNPEYVKLIHGRCSVTPGLKF